MTIMSITMSMVRTAPAAVTITTMSIIMTIMSITMSMAKTAPAAVTITTITTTMPTKSSQAGASKAHASSLPAKSSKSWRPSPKAMHTA